MAAAVVAGEPVVTTAPVAPPAPASALQEKAEPASPGGRARQGEEERPEDRDEAAQDQRAVDSPGSPAGGGSALGSDGGASLSPINVDIQVHCLICSTRVNPQADQYCDIYLDNIVTAHSRLPVSEKLGRVLRYHFSPELLYSHTLCRRCFNIINGIDQLEGRLEKLRSEVRHKFSVTCQERGLDDDHFPPRLEAEAAPPPPVGCHPRQPAGGSS
ncbi:uncharacterized protein LOC119095665 [Pollicipes pollicipes]|uniref:uncharacterized protein LOC119095665 n=1 Tax=Pollicipes pollicipes TaxID=41117 RepID=UPI001884C735|nr:uncharacterized protein LOC119095665 [Pollicipes pollicipes]